MRHHSSSLFSPRDYALDGYCRSCHSWTWLVAVAVAIGLGAFSAILGHDRAVDATATDASWVALFDSQTMQGWEGNTEIFRVSDGSIVAGSLDHPVARNEFLCTQKTYKNFELTMKVKLVGKGANAGIQFRTRRIPNHHEVSGYQADMGEGWWGKLYDESRRNRVLADGIAGQSPPPIHDGWNDYRIRCQGNHIQLWLNDVPTVDYYETDKNIAEDGVIAVQIHGGPPSEAWYQSIRIRELP